MKDRQIAEALGPELPDGPTPAPEVIDLLANACAGRRDKDA